MRRHPILKILLIASGLFLVFGCASSVRSRAPLPLQGRVVTQTDGVQVSADFDAWRGAPSPLRAVLPVQFRVENDSGVPVEIAPEEIRIRFEDGQERFASRPEEIRAEELIPPGFVSRGELLTDAMAMETEEVTRGFRPLGRGTEPGSISPPASSGNEDEYVRIPLPTFDMVQRALRPATVASGEVLEGFLFFENVPADAERGELIARVGGEWVLLPILLG